MAEMFVSAENTNGFVFARSDGEFEQHLMEAIEASNDDYAFRTQLEEALHLSSLKDEKEPTTVNNYEQNYGFEFQDHGGEKGENSAEMELCNICYEDSAAEMFEGIRCLHRFCHPCMTKYIHTLLEQKRHQIHCPHESCGETLTPQECRYFLPVEIIDAWSAVIVEAEIPETQKVYCPFPDCSAMLVKEDIVGLCAEEILNAECPFCNRMFCVRCMVPWHANLDCEEFQKLSPAEREADLRLFKLAENQKWQRCGNCRRMIERVFGCNQMVCRCGYQFCYGCGTGGSSGSRKCNC